LFHTLLGRNLRRRHRALGFQDNLFHRIFISIALQFNVRDALVDFVGFIHESFDSGKNFRVAAKKRENGKTGNGNSSDRRGS